jgi:hypothetical protein
MSLSLVKRWLIGIEATARTHLDAAELINEAFMQYWTAVSFNYGQLARLFSNT